MLDRCRVSNESAVVYRLASVLRDGETLSAMLLRRGSRPEDVSDTVSNVVGKTPLSLSEFIDSTFQGREGEATPFREGRFGDGTIGVYYSAIDEDTCRKEVAFHLLEQIRDLEQDPHPRTYNSIVCRYEGTTIDLRGKEHEFPDLVSETKRGYPFCQEIAHEAVTRGTDGFFAPSARNPDGTCVPVFRREALFEPQTGHVFRAIVQSGRIQFQQAQA